jgi:hypothetical protein
MALKGNLRDFSITQLLNLVNLARKTGKLSLGGHSEEALLFFKDGRLIHAATSSGDINLASMLHKVGKLTDDQVRVAVQRGNSSDRVIGKFLMETKMASRGDIIQGVKDYMLQIVYDLFTWEDGNFIFEQNLLPNKERIVVPLNLDNIILDGSRRILKQKELENELPDLSTIALKITDKPLRDVKLTQDDWRVISHIHPRNTVKQIAQNNNMDEFQIRKIVFGMLQAGIVETIRPEGMEQRRPKTPVTRAGRRVANQSPAEKRSVVTKLIDRIKRI